MSYFKKEERTASTNQILKLAEVFIGILNSQKKLDIDMTDKPTKADAVSMTVDCIIEWENECRAEMPDTFKHLTMADISTFYDMSYRRKGVWCYEEDAAVIALVEEKMLEKFSSFCPMAALGEKQAEAETKPKKKKAAKKQPVTLQTKTKPVDSKAVSVGIKLDDDTREAGAAMGLSPSDVAKFAHLLAKANS
tara:strand:- start:176 stop:754 length:579 start_codon:yes stop_codon:yes gene_type:complete